MITYVQILGGLHPNNLRGQELPKVAAILDNFQL